ncbi:MAG: DUF86 domain-containing protein [Desulfatiglans sp.]|nr:DUF86 domain-containing protein [Desulfatiglans sp.]
MLKNDIIRLRHMLDAAIEAEGFISEKDRNDISNDRKLELALVKCVEIIGEAASSVSKECRDEFPQIPWSDIIGMRNRLIHAYFEINLDILWKTLTDDLPPLIIELNIIIPP